MDNYEPGYKVDENGWTIHHYGDVKDLTDSQYAKIAELVATNTLVIFKNQNLTVDEEIEVARKIGRPQEVANPALPLEGQPAEKVAINHYMLLVSGARNVNGEAVGIAGNKDVFDWHADRVSRRPGRVPALWLYGEKGTKGSRTSFLNLIEGYKHLSAELKEKLNDKQVLCGRWSDEESRFKYAHTPGWTPPPDQDWFNCVMTNNAGCTGLFFPFNQMLAIKGINQDEFDSIVDQIKQEVMQHRFIYHHDWTDGDLVITDQWLSIHKRWEFEKMDERFVHRIGLWTNDSQIGE